MSGPSLHAARGLALSFAFGGVGAVLFHLLGLPAATMLGAMTLAFTAAMAKVPLAFPAWLRTAVMLAIGMTVGGSLDPAIFTGGARWLPSFAVLVASLMASLAAGAYFLRRVGGLNPATAFFSAFPGHLVMVLGAATNSSADVPRVAVMQSLRVVVLAVALPGVLNLTPAQGTEAAPAIQWLNVVVSVGAGLIGWPLARLVRLPAETLTGPILGSGVAALAGFPLGALPAPAEHAILLTVGTMIGARFVGTRLTSFLGMLPLALAGVGVVLAVTAVVALPASMMLDMPFGQVLLAYSPGGGDVMPVIALAMGFDPAFVGMHHFLRLMVMAGVLPLVARRYAADPATTVV